MEIHLSLSLSLCRETVDTRHKTSVTNDNHSHHSFVDEKTIAKSRRNTCLTHRQWLLWSISLCELPLRKILDETMLILTVIEMICSDIWHVWTSRSFLISVSARREIDVQQMSWHSPLSTCSAFVRPEFFRSSAEACLFPSTHTHTHTRFLR